MRTGTGRPADCIRATRRYEFEYPVVFTRDAFNPANADLMECIRRREPFSRHKVFFLLDEAAAAVCSSQARAYVGAHRGSLVLAAPVLAVSRATSGARGLDSSSWLRARMGAAGLDENSHAIVVGAEGLQEAAGFAAATLRPSPRLIRVATTILGQIRWPGRLDSALDFIAGKERAAAFGAPFAIVNDQLWLGRSAKEDRALALAEAVRLALSQDGEFFHWLVDRRRLLRQGKPSAVEPMARWAARLTLGPQTSFGLWGGHALAGLDGASLARARIAGVALDVLLSRELCGLPRDAAETALGLLRGCGMGLWDRSWDEDNRGLAALEAMRSGKVLVLTGAIGGTAPSPPARRDCLAQVVRELRRFQGGIKK